MSIELKILESEKAMQVYFIKDKDKVSLRSKNKNYKVYKRGYDYWMDDFNFEDYDNFIERKGYQPSAKKVGKIYPNPKMICPGIEIMASQNLFEKGGNLFYAIFDSMNLDYSKKMSYSFIKEVNERRKRARISIDRFLRKDLYAPLAKSKKAYEKNLLKLIDTRLKNPRGLFDIRLMCEPKSKSIKFEREILEEALEKNVSIDIDWCLAAKLLGLYATR